MAETLQVIGREFPLDLFGEVASRMRCGTRTRTHVAIIHEVMLKTKGMAEFVDCGAEICGLRGSRGCYEHRPTRGMLSAIQWEVMLSPP